MVLGRGDSQEQWSVGHRKRLSCVSSTEAIAWLSRVPTGDGRYPAGTFRLGWGETQETLAIVQRPRREVAADHCDCDDYGPAAEWDQRGKVLSLQAPARI